MTRNQIAIAITIVSASSCAPTIAAARTPVRVTIEGTTVRAAEATTTSPSCDAQPPRRTRALMVAPEKTIVVRLPYRARAVAVELGSFGDDNRVAINLDRESVSPGRRQWAFAAPRKVDRNADTLKIRVRTARRRCRIYFVATRSP